MKFKKSILFTLFFTFLASSIQIAVANPAGDVASKAAKVTWEQWWKNHSIMVNPYSLYQAINAYPVGAVFSTVGFLAVITGLRGWYHSQCNMRAERYNQIWKGIQADLNGGNKNQLTLEDISSRLKDKRVTDWLNEFYGAVSSTNSRSTIAERMGLYFFGRNNFII
jgi:hypothetical protein